MQNLCDARAVAIAMDIMAIRNIIVSRRCVKFNLSFTKLGHRTPPCPVVVHSLTFKAVPRNQVTYNDWASLRLRLMSRP